MLNLQFFLVDVQQENIISMLLKRSDENSELDPGIDNRVVIGCIKNLIDVEKDYLTTKSSYRFSNF